MELHPEIVIISYAEFMWSDKHSENIQIEDRYAVFNLLDLYEALVENKKECERVHEESLIRYNYLYTLYDYVSDAIDKQLAMIQTDDNQFDVDIIDTAGLMSENELRTMKYCLNNADAFSYPDAMDLFRDKVKPVTNEFIAKFKNDMK